MDERLRSLINDTTSGSTDLLIKLAGILESKLDSPAQLKQMINSARESLDSFGTIITYLDNIMKALEKDSNQKIMDAVRAPLQKRDVYIRMLADAGTALKDINRVFTFSNSRTVYEILKIMNRQRKNFQVLITESMPKKEGRKLARRLLRERVRVEFGPDVMMSPFISTADAVFIGADKLLPGGGVLNKTGSLNAAILADYYKKPFFVFAESSKNSSTFVNKSRDPEEVWKFRDKNLKVNNFYFEQVPPELITSIFTGKEQD